MSRKRKNELKLALALSAALVAFIWVAQRIWRTSSLAHPGKVLVTGYCNCEKCCGWKRLPDGSTVYTYGKMKGQPKRVGVTSRGKIAKHGTIAADLRHYPYGTRLNVPGYGTGVVEDIGGAIKGHHIDVWFPTHQEAKRWGAKWLKVEPL